MKKVTKYLAILAACFLLITNLHLALLDYGLPTIHLSQSVLAQTGSSNGSSSGSSGGDSGSDPVPTACPTATITTATYNRDNPSHCTCTVKRKISVSGSAGTSPGGSISYETYSFSGIENTCKSSSNSGDHCSAYACSTSQSGGGTGGGTSN
ncbi:hypothetical protein [Chitinophaga pinensis]|uniref:Uncharacterized protein n=1 Tax=Chitinophaga pinensis (strain ATCC 43595 / DSM 2588 / LMG 13176 / NBRC 15968 / NCIMB 11800 / UQM 2034) TaxID=485918 RepID=A0A979GAX5_CHIPD|nr:hypothetical protein [Chitinophaga pinensis]ACU64050.1 hypothetical protein Cpin_6646 [Chitinophaga pinensis DSM 2588]